MLIAFAKGAIRDWRDDDLDRLVQLGDNRKIWRNLRDRFPSPYTRADGEAWIRQNASVSPRTAFAIEVEGRLAGSIGLILGTDIHARSAEVGYWLGEPYWRRGIATGALQAFVPWCFREFDLVRIWAAVFEDNVASARVLEKAGFEREARLRRSAFKDGRVQDEWLYARLHES